MDQRKIGCLPDIQRFEYQVAGHKTDDSGCSGLLKHKDGYVLKPIPKSSQGDNEISFYERVKHDAELLPLQNFIPEYFGCLYLNINNADIRFLKLQDITSLCLKPCVMDVKIGKLTWEPNASVEKRKSEDAKYAISKREFGFCIPGYRVFDISLGLVIKFGKEEGKRLGRESTIEAFKQFFNYSCGFSSVILKHIMKQMTDLLGWWNSQNVIHIYSSSILLVYDAEKLNNMLLGALKEEELAADDSWVKIRMIDFAHVVPADCLKDDNYISGLSNLIAILKSIM
ncbi:inositol polyphosphate multikinase isoform X1 [Halyomorpha halys]|uniref:inositol polyphosphate multikinase isoform X1 n=1 Tax=Halyomorpha halys TaxID=286706 RepID=UPI0006D51885|nr:inositol polyphosphate multikinase isoform X1 [Halyomorpha halys]